MPTTTVPSILTGSYAIDRTHKLVRFVARHAMVAKVRGSFSPHRRPSRPRRRGGTAMTTFTEPVVAWRGDTGGDGPLVGLLHGRGSQESDITALADHLPGGLTYAAARARIAEGDGYAWFANRGVGRPVAGSLADTMAWFRTWLDDVTPTGAANEVAR